MDQLTAIVRFQGCIAQLLDQTCACSAGQSRLHFVKQSCMSALISWCALCFVWHNHKVQSLRVEYQLNTYRPDTMLKAYYSELFKKNRRRADTDKGTPRNLDPKRNNIRCPEDVARPSPNFLERLRFLIQPCWKWSTPGVILPNDLHIQESASRRPQRQVGL